jgi:hypothetical protein
MDTGFPISWPTIHLRSGFEPEPYASTTLSFAATVRGPNPSGALSADHEVPLLLVMYVPPAKHHQRLCEYTTGLYLAPVPV